VDDLHFTTGDGPVDKAPETPSARITQYRMDSNICGVPRIGTCVAIGDDHADVVMTIIGPSQPDMSIGHRGSFFSPISIAFGLGESVEIRTRALNGTLSRPIRLDESTFTSIDIHETDGVSCTSDGLKLLPPSANFVPIGASRVPVPDAGKPQMPASDAGVHAADAEVADAGSADAQPVFYIEGKRPSDSGCAATGGGAPVPLALLCLFVLALRRRTHGG
jgi:uncharacterized protein (TIGR03382 family)